MRSVPTTLLLGVLAALLSLPACGANGGLVFDAPSEDEMRARVHLEASATLDSETLPWVFEETRYVIAFTTAFLRFTEVYAGVFTASGFVAQSLTAADAGGGAIASSEDGLGAREAALSYQASGYISFSCPGSDLDAPDFLFQEGDARIESPGVVAVDDIATVEPGAVFRLTFGGGCRVGGDVLGGDLYGLFESPWVLSADIDEDFGEGRRGVRADIELASNRLTVLLHDDAGGLFKIIVTHPDGVVTSARFEGVNGACLFDITRDASGSYQLGETPPRCDF